MACACKVNQQLSYLERKYGTNPKSKKTSISTRVKVFFVGVMNVIISVILSPFMLMTVFFNRKKVINISKLFGLSAK